MAIASPQCQDSFVAQQPGAHGRPERLRPAMMDIAPEPKSPHAPRWHEGLSSRLFLCPFMILGLCYGLLLLASSVATLITKDAANSSFDHRFGFALFTGLQGFAVLCLTPLVGLGQKQGYLYGGVVGLGTGLVVGLTTAAGLTSELAQPFLQTAAGSGRDMVLWVLPLIHCLCGVVGGITGGRIWRPLPPLPAPHRPAPGQALDSRLAQAVNVRPHGWLPWDGPILWGRIVVGILVAVCGIVCAGEIVSCLVDAGEGYFKVANESQHRATIGEIFALSILLGGCIAGGGTPNGLKQGLAVGIVAGAAMISLMAAGAIVSSDILPAPIVWAVFLGAVGGWFGTELLPPPSRRVRLAIKRPR